MIKKLSRSIREFKKPTLLTSIFVSLEVVFEILIPLIMAELINQGINKGQMDIILKLGAILVTLAVLSFVFGTFSANFCAKAGVGFSRNLRNDLFEKIQKFSFYNIDKFSTSSLITRVTTDVYFCRMAFQMIIRVAVRSPLMIIFAMASTFVINWQMGLILLIASPLLFGALILILKYVHPQFKKVINEYDDMNTVVKENISAIRVVKSYVKEEHEIEKFSDVSGKIYKDYSKARKLLALNAPCMQIAIYTCIVVISLLGSKLIVESGGTTLNVGQLQTLFQYTMQILMSLMMFSMVIINIAISHASAQRIVEVIDEVPNIVSPENAKTNIENGSIEFENVSFSYTGDISKLCLKDINLKIESGETVGILGGTGSSKSTLVSLIPRLYDTTSGKILVGNKNVKDYDLQALRDSVAMVLQKNVLFSGTIKENLKWGKEDATDEEMKHACILACADEFIENFPNKYDTYIEQGGANVSGGQKQRLCIARALLKKPKILILDDSTSAVDTKTDSLIRKAFKEEIPNTTKIIIAQRVNSVMDADKIVLLEGGKISAVGKHEELLKTSEMYKEIYITQTQKKGGIKND